MKRLLIVAVLICCAAFLFAGPEAEQTTSKGDTHDYSSFRAENYVFATIEEYEERTGKTIDSFQESPDLTEMVGHGIIPKLEERLPVEPLVIKPVGEQGKYGGTLYTAAPGIGGWSDMDYARISLLYRTTETGAGHVPDIAKGYELSDDNKSITIYLREGMKWSDGEPVTADDMMFWWEARVLYEDFLPVWKFWTPGGEVAKFEKLDDYSVKMTFAVPYPVIEDLLVYTAWNLIPRPAHYLKKYHPAYNPKIDELMKEEGYDDWTSMAWDHGLDGRTTGPGWKLPEIPHIGGWILDTWATTELTYVRNPFYHAIDTEGNQLPYIDKMVKIAAPVEVIGAKAIAGQLDLVAAEAKMSDYTLYMENRDSGNYRVVPVSSGLASQGGLKFNITHQDLEKRKIYGNVDFRRAMSLAINRDRINEIVFFGMGKPRAGAAPHPTTSFYKPEWETMWSTFEQDKANQMLDEVGLDKRDSEGFRLLPNGEPLTAYIQYIQVWGPHTEIFELVKEDWEAVGVRTKLDMVGWDVFNLMESNTSDVNNWQMARMTEKSYRAHDTIGHTDEGWAFAGYSIWRNTNGEQGVEPPEEFLTEWYPFQEEWWAMPQGSPEYIARAQRLFDWLLDNVFVIGTVGMVPVPVIIHNDLMNVPFSSEWGVFSEDNHKTYAFLAPQWWLDR